MGLLISKANDKNQTLVTINGYGVFFQELRLGDRPQSPRVRVGKLVVLEEEGIVVDYDAIDDYEGLLVSRDTDTRVLTASEDVLSTLMRDVTANKDAIAIRQEQNKKLRENLRVTNDAILSHPIRNLSCFNAVTMQNIDKLLDKVRYRHKHIEGSDGVRFTHYPSRAYFIQRQAEDLLTRHNEALEKRGIESGYMDFDTALATVKARFNKVQKTTTTTTPTATATTPTATATTATTPTATATTATTKTKTPKATAKTKTPKATATTATTKTKTPKATAATPTPTATATAATV
jgi:hypothetical protein